MDIIQSNMRKRICPSCQFQHQYSQCTNLQQLSQYYDTEIQQESEYQIINSQKYSKEFIDNKNYNSNCAFNQHIVSKLQLQSILNNSEENSLVSSMSQNQWRQMKFMMTEMMNELKQMLKQNRQSNEARNKIDKVQLRASALEQKVDHLQRKRMDSPLIKNQKQSRGNQLHIMSQNQRFDPISQKFLHQRINNQNFTKKQNKKNQLQKIILLNKKYVIKIKKQMQMVYLTFFYDIFKSMRLPQKLRFEIIFSLLQTQTFLQLDLRQPQNITAYISYFIKLRKLPIYQNKIKFNKELVNVNQQIVKSIDRKLKDVVFINQKNQMVQIIDSILKQIDKDLDAKDFVDIYDYLMAMIHAIKHKKCKTDSVQYMKYYIYAVVYSILLNNNYLKACSTLIEISGLSKEEIIDRFEQIIGSKYQIENTQ